MLKTVALAGMASAWPMRSAPAASAHEFLLRYLESLARPDGGYGFEGQERSHLTATCAVVGCYRLLRRMPPKRDRLDQFIRRNHPRELKKLEQERRTFEFQQTQALAWLESDLAEFHDAIRPWTKPLAYLRQYEQNGYPIFQSEMGALYCRALLKLPLGDLSPDFTSYLDSRRRPNGTYNNTPAVDGTDGHVMNTWWGLQAAQLLGQTPAKKESTIAWLRACQRPSGGFTFQPKPEFGGVDDIAYTRAAVRSLQLLGATLPGDACVRWIHSLRDAEGGFSDRPGWQANPLATYSALDALDALGALDTLPMNMSRPRRIATKLPNNLKVFSIQIESHGQGSPHEAVDLAQALRIHLWGAKNARPGWIARAQAIARRNNAPVQFFASNEEYGTWVNIPGMGTYSHTSDVIAPADSTFGAPMGQRAPGAASRAVSWPEFRRGRLAPLEHAKGRLIWQFGENEELVRMFLDDSVERGGYAAISTYHFGNPDFTNSEPFLHRWRGQIPFVALQDAHGAEPWWFADMTAGFRTLFIATEPTWDAWLDALKEQRVVAVRRDALSRGQTWMHGSSRETIEFVREREEQWRWWSNPAIARPLVSIVALTPEDEFEVARPERGIALRVRCARANTAQGIPKEPLAEFVRLIVDDAEVQPELVSTRALRGNAIVDYYHRYDLAHPAAGVHRAAVTVRSPEAKTEVTRTIEFRA